MSETPSIEVPKDWPVPTEEQLEKAHGATSAALGTDEAVESMVRYYSRSSNFAGATFLELDPVDPYHVTSGDLLAITMLSVQAEPQAVRRLLEPTTASAEITRLLAEGSLPLDANLEAADAATLLAMASLHEATKSALSLDSTKNANSWVTASKLTARKRPDLFPVRDSVVCDLLGLSGRAQNYQVDWQVFRSLVQDRTLMGRLDAVVDEAASREGVNVGHPNRRLRHLDVVLWMRGRRR